MTTGRRVVLVVGGLVALAAVAWTTLSVVSLLGRTTDTRVDTFAAPAVGVQVRTETGDVDVVPSTDGQVRVETRARYGLRAPEQSRTVSGGDLLLEAECLVVDTICQVDYVISAPLDLAVVVRTGTGDVDVAGVAGKVDVNAGTGDVTVDDVSGDVSINTGTGSVRGRDLDGGRVSADTGTGDVHLTFVDIPDDVRADTGAGDVTVELPDTQPYAVDTDTGVGDQSVSVDTDGSSPHRVSVRTGTGDITVRPVE